MNFYFYSYMEDIAINLRQLRHNPDTNPRFFKIDNITSLEGFLTKLRNIKDTIMLVDISVDGFIGTKGTDNYTDTPTYKFYILRQAKHNDTETQAYILQQNKKTGYSILSKMLKDKTAGLQGLYFLDLSHVPYISVGPLANNWYGVEFFFSVTEYNNELVYNPLEWI